MDAPSSGWWARSAVEREAAWRRYPPLQMDVLGARRF